MRSSRGMGIMSPSKMSKGGKASFVKNPKKAMGVALRAIALSEAFDAGMKSKGPAKKAMGGMMHGGKVHSSYAEGGESKVNEAGNYTKPGMRKSLFGSIKSGGKGGAPGQWSARKAQMLALQYKSKGGGYK